MQSDWDSLVKGDQLHQVFPSQLEQMTVGDGLRFFSERRQLCHANIIRDQFKPNLGRRLRIAQLVDEHCEKLLGAYIQMHGP
jgi:hypothetical protein